MSMCIGFFGDIPMNCEDKRKLQKLFRLILKNISDTFFFAMQFRKIIQYNSNNVV